MQELYEHPGRWKWTRASYYFAWEKGVFGDKRVELVFGEVVEKEYPTPPIATVCSVLSNDVRRALCDRFSVFGTRMPLIASEQSEPEPDFYVSPGEILDYKNEHPRQAFWVVEVAKQELAFDLKVKSALYAQMPVPDYWVADVENRVLHVHREPTSQDGRFFYASVSQLTGEEKISPLLAPDFQIGVRDLMP